MRVQTSGRTDVSDYFEKSGIRDWKKLTHTPVLVFIEGEEGVQVEIVFKPAQLLNYPDETKAMGQWQGKWSSDFFQFTIGQLRQHIAEHPNPGYRVI